MTLPRSPRDMAAIQPHLLLGGTRRHEKRTKGRIHQTPMIKANSAMVMLRGSATAMWWSEREMQKRKSKFNKNTLPHKNISPHRYFGLLAPHRPTHHNNV
ncbi:uncharacterized protein TM35_000521380 [Trypanosoma theileri]|uniref:Uncharacterized protein n=1 Tax=Trypanosoma theileri TaxID=67003 RepID=A0A1X0NGU3_9TRYP|nr:uncharacterized protein TM35_000521380 [Trypanosoma theileri]ORC83994.1 hypothetical protein TM35_000521380 [Trypanosoma theileri]